MNALLALFEVQIRQASAWFATQTGSKVTVIGGMATVLLGVSWLLYAISHAFFTSLSSYDQFGQATVSYLVHAAIIVTMWLAIGSVIVTTMSVLFSTKQSLNVVTTSPQPSHIVPLYLFGYSVASSIILLVIVMGPVGMALADVYFSGAWMGFWLRAMLTIIIMATITSSVGALVAYGLSFLTVLKNARAIVGGVGLVFLGVTMQMVGLVFPKSLGQLYDASAAEFPILFAALPLNRLPLPTAALSHMLTRGWVGEFWIVAIVSCGVSALLIAASSMIFPYLWRHLEESGRAGGLRVGKKEALHGPLSTRWFMQYKDMLATARSPSDVSYGILLMVIAVFFFTMLGQIVRNRPVQSAYAAEFTVFVMAWLLFFVTAYLLRLVFPQIAREKRQAWHMFTSPIRFEDILTSKMELGLILSVPLAVFATVVWASLSGNIALVVVSVWSIVLLTLMHASLGAVWPNFASGDDADRVSTSPMGFVTLFASVGLSIAVSAAVHTWLAGSMPLMALFGGMSVLTLVIMFLYPLARLSSANYEF